MALLGMVARQPRQLLATALVGDSMKNAFYGVGPETNHRGTRCTSFVVRSYFFFFFWGGVMCTPAPTRFRFTSLHHGVPGPCTPWCPCMRKHTLNISKAFGYISGNKEKQALFQQNVSVARDLHETSAWRAVFTKTSAWRDDSMLAPTVQNTSKWAHFIWTRKSKRQRGADHESKTSAWRDRR